VYGSSLKTVSGKEPDGPVNMLLRRLSYKNAFHCESTNSSAKPGQISDAINKMESVPKNRHSDICHILQSLPAKLNLKYFAKQCDLPPLPIITDRVISFPE
jgi:hypothetical protein